MFRAVYFGYKSDVGHPLPLLRLEPQHHDRVWGGRRFSTSDRTIGELWVVWHENRVADGPLAGRTLGQLAAELGPRLVGRPTSAFPLLVKLLDTRDWLSVQVHPDDEQARQLEGEGYVGKTEAWHVLDADPDAKVIGGLKPGADRDGLQRSLDKGSLLELVDFCPVSAGDTLFIRAGTIHALGPGLFMYEVQQSSDITYRVWDWDRPASSNRPLHVAQTLAVADPAARAELRSLNGRTPMARAELVASRYFVLERIAAESQVPLDTDGTSFHALTVTSGHATVVAGEERVQLAPFETVLVPAERGAYRLEAEAPFSALLARLP
jgi:mannose-6-phosphate isomerase